MSPRLQALSKYVKEHFDHNDPSHDFAHLKRVVKTCMSIGRSQGADLEILLPAAYLHDAINISKDHPDRAKASELASIKAKEILERFDYLPEEIGKIMLAIKEHSYSRGLAPSSLESAILQDADRLDAIGAIGVMRTVTCGAQFGARYYHADEPFSEGRLFDDKSYTLDHFFVKLLTLAEKLNTPEAKQEARRRTEFMHTFLEELRQEI